MKSFLFPVALTALIFRPLPAQTPGPASTTAFVHVGVVPMDDTNRVLHDQTVVVRGSRIVALGPAASVTVPAGATRVNGDGKYLIPGLADMHTHVGMGDATKDMAGAESALFKLAANGVTTIRNVNYGGFEADSVVLLARSLAAAGKLWSPRIYASSKWRKDPEKSIAQNLAAYRAAGYDFIKLHEGDGERGLGLDSIALAAHLLGIPFMGHVTTEFSQQSGDLFQALALHYASIEHLTGYPGGGIGYETVTADTVKLPTMIAATVQAGVWNCPTHSMYEWLYGDAVRRVAMGDSLKRLGLKDSLPTHEDSLTITWLKLRRRIIKGLQDAGGGLLLGVDLGEDVQHELQSLVADAGLTPYQALATGTRNVAAYFGNLRTEGTVMVGKRADLVLLNGNPLDDIKHTAQPAGVMINGHWLSRVAIDRRLAKIAAADSAATRKSKEQPKQP